jgi:hypothetical protein
MRRQMLDGLAPRLASQTRKAAMWVVGLGPFLAAIIEIIGINQLHTGNDSDGRSNQHNDLPNPFDDLQRDSFPWRAARSSEAKRHRRNFEQLPCDDPALVIVGMVDQPSSLRELVDRNLIDVLLVDTPTREL